jgi:hypothetical protein
MKKDKVIVPARTCETMNSEWFNFDSVVVDMTLKKDECVMDLGVFMMDLSRYARTLYVGTLYAGTLYAGTLYAGTLYAGTLYELYSYARTFCVGT